MFCPGCGMEEKQANQFCRACGTDLRMARAGLEKPDTITASAVSARDEIGRAVASKILETKSTTELAKVTEEVLPQIEKFLESPAEKRLRRMRNGMIVSSVGFGGAIGFFFMNILLKENYLVMLTGLSIITFFIGLSFVINGFLLTVPKKSLHDKASDAKSQRDLDIAEANTNELLLQETDPVFTSITEHTTHHLQEKQPLSRS